MKNLLYVLHSGTAGGTFLTNDDLMKNVEGHYEIVPGCDSILNV